MCWMMTTLVERALTVLMDSALCVLCYRPDARAVCPVCQARSRFGYGVSSQGDICRGDSGDRLVLLFFLSQPVRSTRRFSRRRTVPIRRVAQRRGFRAPTRLSWSMPPIPEAEWETDTGEGIEHSVNEKEKNNHHRR
jgi:hypothetical protein